MEDAIVVGGVVGGSAWGAEVADLVYSTGSRIVGGLDRVLQCWEAFEDGCRLQ
jgi:hypothetical protein